MFCEECGTKNENNAAFCEKCGHKMVETSKIVSKEKKQMTKKSKIIIAISFVIVALLIGMYIYIGNLCNPKNIAINYFKAYAANDTEKMYNILDLENSTFVSKKLFTEKMKNKNGEIKLENYKVKKVEKEDLTTSVTISYLEEGSSYERTFTVKLIKNKNKKWLLFENWNVDKTRYVAKDFEIYVPKNSTFKIDGKKVDEKYKTSEASTYTNYDEYKIPELINVEYDLLIKLESNIEITSKMNVYSGSYSYYKVSSPELTKESNKKMEKDIKDKLQALYTAALENKTFDEIKESYSIDSQLDVEDDFNDIKDAMNYNDQKVTKTELIDVKITDITIIDGDLDIDANIKFKYTLSYKEDNKNKTFESDEKNDIVYLTYSYVDGKLVISDLFGLNDYYTKY